MAIKHILKDGTEPNDITGHIVKRSQAENLYTLLDSINSKNRKENDNERID